MAEEQQKLISSTDEKLYEDFYYKIVNHPNLKSKKYELMNKDEEKSAGSLLWAFLKQIRPGANLVSLTCPSVFLSPYSYLETRTDYAAPIPYLLFGLNKKELKQTVNNVETKNGSMRRFLNLSKWILCNLSFTPNNGVARMKPYNPILGEQFHCLFQHDEEANNLTEQSEEKNTLEENSKKKNYSYFEKLPKKNKNYTYCVSEQVRHHPPITSQHMENSKHGFVYDMTTIPEPEFSLWYNYLKVNFFGDSVFRFYFDENEKEFEDYHISVPPILTYGIVWGTPTVQHEGFLTVKNIILGYKMIVKCYNEKNKVLGVIMKVSAGEKLTRTKKEKEEENKENEKIISKLSKNSEKFFSDNLNALVKIEGSLMEGLKFIKVRELKSTPFGLPSPWKTYLEENKISEKEINEICSGFQEKNNIEIIDFKKIKFPEKIVKPVHEQNRNESRNVWHQVTKSIWQKDLKTASEMKHNLEEAQRARRKAFTSPFKPEIWVIDPKKEEEVSLEYVYHPENNKYTFENI